MRVTIYLIVCLLSGVDHGMVVCLSLWMLFSVVLAGGGSGSNHFSGNKRGVSRSPTTSAFLICKKRATVVENSM